MERIAKNLYRHENGTYYTLHRAGNRQFKKSLRTKDKGDAKALLRQSRLNGVVGASAPATSVSDPTAAPRPGFVAAVEEHARNTPFARSKTERNFLQRKRTLLGHCRSWDEFQPVSIWKKYEARGLVSAPNQLRWYLRSFVDYCVDRSWLSLVHQKDVAKIPLKKVPPRRVHIPEPEKVRDLLLMVEAEDFDLGQFLRWLAGSGLRLDGARNVSWSEVNFGAQEYVRLMKGGEKVVIPLLPEAAALLRARWETAGRPTTGLVFELNDYRIRKLRRLLHKYARGLDVSLDYPHAFRHYVGSVALASGLSAGEVARLLGHRDGGKLVLSTYGHVIPTQLKAKVSGLRMVA